MRVCLADIVHMLGWWTSGIDSPGITEGKDVSSCNSTSRNKIINHSIIVVATETLNLTLVHWVKLNDHLGTLVPLNGQSNVSGNENPQASVSKMRLEG